MRGIVYVAGPMTIGPREDNIAKAMKAAEQIWELDFAPFVPHLSFFYNDWLVSQGQEERNWEDWLKYDETIIKSCCALFRVPGQSKGAERECLFAIDEKIPVFLDMRYFKQWADTYPTVDIRLLNKSGD